MTPPGDTPRPGSPRRASLVTAVMSSSKILSPLVDITSSSRTVLTSCSGLGALLAAENSSTSSRLKSP